MGGPALLNCRAGERIIITLLCKQPAVVTGR